MQEETGKKKLKMWEEQMAFITSCISDAGKVERIVGRLGAYLEERTSVEQIFLEIVPDNFRTKQVFIWEAEKKGEAAKESRMFPIYFGENLCAKLTMVMEEGLLPGSYERFMELICKMMGIILAYEESAENEKRSNDILTYVLDGIKARIYISDLDTDEILFMNQVMREEFKLRQPIGRTCWELLQRDKKGRCPFCPVQQLKTEKPGKVIEWDEISLVTGKSYKNYDSLIRWVDGRIVHLQQSVDVTEIKLANTDELTGFMMRRPGKSAMNARIEAAQKNGEIITVCMYDINRLKDVNDRFGHAEGDRLIAKISREVGEELTKGEFAFRLSGDEFIVLFVGKKEKVKKRVDGIIGRLKESGKRYEVSFCYGLLQIDPNDNIALDRVLFLVDERMYEQKRKFHILLNERKRKETEDSVCGEEFVYNKELLYDALVQSTDDYIYVCNMKTGVFRYTKAMKEEFDLPGEIIANAAAVWGAKVHENDKQAFLESNQEISDSRVSEHCVEYRAKNKKGEWVWVRCRGHLEFDEGGEPELFAGFITKLGQKNKIDGLTGLYNKVVFEDEIHELTEDAGARRFGIMVFGIDNLKNINNLYNRAFGNEVIRIVAQRMRTLLSANCSLYRLDGDEFGVIIRSGDTDDVVYEMERLYRLLKRSFAGQQEYEGRKYFCTLSAGCLVCPKDADNYQDIMKCAGYSLEYSKTHGKDMCTFFTAKFLEERTRALLLLDELRRSAEENCTGFYLNYQPIVDAGTKEVKSVEALARWNSESFGGVSPTEFIPILEKAGLIVPVGKWILEKAVHTAAQWQKRKPALWLNVNISYLQIREPDFVPFVLGTLEREGYPCQNLVLELTESYFSVEDEYRETFRQLEEKGIKIAVDDFGTGYSTLGLLKEAPVDLVKIDKTFVDGIKNSFFDATFIKFVAELCHNVGMDVCLEGVESPEEYEKIKAMDLDMIQGFLFYKPLSEQRITKMLFPGGDGCKG